MLVNPYSNATAAQKRQWRARCWCFTWNNPDQELIGEDVGAWEHVNQAAWQLEIGDQGTEHYQGYVTFTVPMRLAAVRSQDEETSRFHWEPRWRTHNQCVAYATKEDRLEGPFYYPSRLAVMGRENDRGLGRGQGGPRGGQGHRSDLQVVADALHAGAKIEQPEMPGPDPTLTGTGEQLATADHPACGVDREEADDDYRRDHPQRGARHRAPARRHVCEMVAA